MPVLKHCVVIDDRVYCWDVVRQKFVAAKLDVDDSAGKVPDEARKLIAMKEFGLVEKSGDDSVARGM